MDGFLDHHTKMKRENSSNILNLSSLGRMNSCQVAGARVWWVVGSCTMDWYEMVKPLLLVRVQVLVHPRTFFIIHCSSSDSYLIQFHHKCKYHPTEHTLACNQKPESLNYFKFQVNSTDRNSKGVVGGCLYHPYKPQSPTYCALH